MLHTCVRRSRSHKYELAPDKCEIAPLVYRKDSHGLVELYGEPQGEVDMHKYLELPFGAKGLDTGRMCEVIC